MAEIMIDTWSFVVSGNGQFNQTKEEMETFGYELVDYKSKGTTRIYDGVSGNTRYYHEVPRYKMFFERRQDIPNYQRICELCNQYFEAKNRYYRAEKRARVPIHFPTIILLTIPAFFVVYLKTFDLFETVALVGKGFLWASGIALLIKFIRQKIRTPQVEKIQQEANEVIKVCRQEAESLAP